MAEPAPLAARSIGGYAKGCLAGGVALPINGPDWQVMRLSRNRNWGNPQLVDYLERLASDARALDGWPGLLVGDMSQPRGGPMLTGHTSHQVGLDADIWLTPMPDRILTPQEREEMSARVDARRTRSTSIPTMFTLGQVEAHQAGRSYPQVARIFVHPAIKKALCAQADAVGKDRAWLGKVRPWWNHYYHFHVRLSCPPGQDGCDEPEPGERRRRLRQGARQLVRDAEEVRHLDGAAAAARPRRQTGAKKKQLQAHRSAAGLQDRADRGRTRAADGR